MAKILIVDDDRDILRLLEFAITRAGHQVIAGQDGLQGLALVEKEKPDLIVADVMMPKMTGYEFCRRVRTNPGLAEVPIIIFSARFQPIDKQTAMESGATDYMPKSTSPDLLVQRIAELLPGDNGPGRVGGGHTTIGVFSLRGGSGVTSLAVNLSVALALGRRVPVGLVDLTPLGGHAALMLGLRPNSSVTAAVSGGVFTLETLKPHLLVHSSGVHLLPSALAYEQQLTFDDGRLPSLLSTLKSGFPFSLLDLPSSLAPGLAPVFQSLDKILLILSADMPSLQSAALALQALARLGLAENKILPVVNYVAAQGILPLEIIQKTIKRPVSLEIPHEPEMIKSVNSGKPLLLNRPQAAGATAIARLAQILLTEKVPG